MAVFAQIVLDFGAGVLLLGTFMSLAKRVDGSSQFPSTQVFLTGVGLVSIGMLLCRITSPGPQTGSRIEERRRSWGARAAATP